MRTINVCILFICCFLFSECIAQKKDLQFTYSKVQPCPLLSPPSVSSVLGDATDPVMTCGLSVSVLRDGTPISAESYVLSAVSSNHSVVSDTGIHISKQEGKAIVFIYAFSAGYSDITFTLQSGKSTAALLLHFAASVATAADTKTRWHTGGSDASAALPAGGKYMLVADDELDHIFLYDRYQSGLPLSSFYYGDKLDLTDGSAPFFKEVDVEAGAISPTNAKRTYWLGSMSNSANFNLKPNRDRLFAVDIKDTGQKTSFSVTGYYDNLRQLLVAWGNDHGYKFGKSAATGKNPKQDDGFNVEAAAFAPDNTTLYIGFRAPLVPVAERKKAVIAPLLNFETWFNKGKTKGKPSFGEPIEMDLGGRGFRDMIRLSNGLYIILAGSTGNVHNGAVYKWSGNAPEPPVLIPELEISGLNAEGVLEMDDEKGNLLTDRIQVVSDNGTSVYYNDGQEAKELGQTAFRKFRSDIIISRKPVLAHP